jgi:PASTA domain
MPGRTHTVRHLLLAVAVLAFFGATVGTAFGMTNSSSADRRTVSDSQGASPSSSSSASGDQGGQAAQDASSGDQTGTTDTTSTGADQGDQTGQTGQTGTDGSGNQTTKVTVPWVKNQNETYARGKIKDAGLTAQVKYVCQDGVDPWTVVDQSPNGDTQANKGSKVQLKVQGVKVLSVVGVYHADAKSQLEGQGLKVVEKDAQPGDSGGAVSKQNPAGGSCVKPGTTVTITVGTTTDPTTSPSPAADDTTNSQTNPTN